MKRILQVLLIEDDIQLNTTISNFLQSIGFDVTALFDGEAAIVKIDSNDCDLYIIDINLPYITGLDVVKYIRQKDITSPIIIITASLELQNLQDAYKEGCNEYIKKPFFLEELEIRINNLLTDNTNRQMKIASNISYDLQYEELYIDDINVKLRKKEKRLLTVLLQNINHTVSNETLCNYIWENEIREHYPLRQLVTDLRKKFNTVEKFIFADIGTGYRFETRI
jgi:DNA-binding response OmpR family regulator